MLQPRGGSPDPEELPEEQPLDPEVERVQRRLRRLMLISGVTTLLGFGAVAVTIFYRLTVPDNPGDPPAAARPAPEAAGGLAAEIAVPLPPGTRVLSVAAGDGELFLHVAQGEGRALLAVDRRTGEIVQRIRLSPAPPRN